MSPVRHNKQFKYVMSSFTEIPKITLNPYPSFIAKKLLKDHGYGVFLKHPSFMFISL